MTAHDTPVSQSHDVRNGEPFVSVVIPARNEELNLAACLDSMVHQTGIAFEIIVVDDNSTDRTAEIAAAYADVQVITPGPLPAGWSGKSHAISKAIPYAHGNWFLFTDADTIHRPNSIEKGVNEAIDYGADLLSYSPYQLTESFWERLLQPIVFAELSREFNYSDVSDPSSPSAAANGQYILMRKKTYLDVGGHAAIKGALLEDVALARAVKQTGVKLRFRYGPDIVSARMYRNFSQIWEGWTKNLTRLFPSVLSLACRRLLESIAVVGGVLLCLAGLLHHSAIAASLGLCAAASSFAFTVRRFKNAQYGLGTTLISIPGLPLFSALLVNSFITTKLLKRSVWKGRTYSNDLA